MPANRTAVFHRDMDTKLQEFQGLSKLYNSAATELRELNRKFSRLNQVRLTPLEQKQAFQALSSVNTALKNPTADNLRSMKNTGLRVFKYWQPLGYSLIALSVAFLVGMSLSLVMPVSSSFFIPAILGTGPAMVASFGCGLYALFKNNHVITRVELKGLANKMNASVLDF